VTHGPISDTDFEQQITDLVARKLATVQTKHLPDLEGSSMVRAVIVGCTYENPTLGTGGIWWSIGHNRFEQIGLVMAIANGLQEPTVVAPYDEED